MNNRLTPEDVQTHRNSVVHDRDVGPRADARDASHPVKAQSNESSTSPISQQAFDDLVARPRNQSPSGTGPGSELKRMLPWLAKACKTEPLKRRIATINQWGVKGCRLNSETIAAWLVRESVRQGMDGNDSPVDTARALVRTAIRRYERKFPDGPLETD